MTEEKTLVKDVKNGLSDMQEQVSEALHKVWPFRSNEVQETGERETLSFPVDIYETKDGFELIGEMPGVSKEGVNIQVSDNELVIGGKFHVSLDGDERVTFHEIPGADYRRTFTLTDGVDRDQISAELKDGVLKVHLAKSESMKPREIEITTS